MNSYDERKIEERLNKSVYKITVTKPVFEVKGTNYNNIVTMALKEEQPRMRQ